MNVDGGLKDSRWIRGLGVRGCPRRPTYALLPNLKKGLVFVIGEESRFFLSSVFYTPAAKCFCIRRLAGARNISPGVV